MKNESKTKKAPKLKSPSVTIELSYEEAATVEAILKETELYFNSPSKTKYDLLRKEQNRDHIETLQSLIKRLQKATKENV